MARRGFAGWTARVLLTLAVLVLVLALCACLAPAPTGQGAGKRVRVAVDPRLYPLEYLDDQKQLAGFDVDLARALAELAGWELEFVQTSRLAVFGQGDDLALLEGLNGGQFDAVISAITIDSGIQSDYGVSQPYLNAGPVTLVDLDSPAIGLDDLRPQAVGVFPGGPAEKLVKASWAAKDIHRYYQAEAAMDDLVEGRISSLVIGLPQAAAALGRNDKLRACLRFIGGPLNEDDLLGIVVQEDNAGLLDQINQGLKALEANGSLAKLRDRWLYCRP